MSEEEIDSYFEDREAEAWASDCKSMNSAEDSAREFKAWLADESYTQDCRI